MIAFRGKQEVKDFYLARVRGHIAADEVVHGVYWQDGRGCGVGCTIHGSEHARYETELGIPTAIAYLKDRMFEAQSNGASKTWPERFLEDLANRLRAARDVRAARAARAAWDARDAWDARAAFVKASAEHLLVLLANAPVPPQSKQEAA